jgi:pilus assembly protein Flp/PilA
MLPLLRSFVRDESGATAIEYGLLAALVSVAAIAALTAMGGSLETMFTSVADILSCATGSTTSGGAACPGAAP